eukprot:6176405-Pleurochrysis_carterae.AAC.4
MAAAEGAGFTAGEDGGVVSQSAQNRKKPSASSARAASLTGRLSGRARQHCWMEGACAWVDGATVPGKSIVRAKRGRARETPAAACAL